MPTNSCHTFWTHHTCQQNEARTMQSTQQIKSEPSLKEGTKPGVSPKTPKVSCTQVTKVAQLVCLLNYGLDNQDLLVWLPEQGQGSCLFWLALGPTQAPICRRYISTGTLSPIQCQGKEYVELCLHSSHIPKWYAQEWLHLSTALHIKAVVVANSQNIPTGTFKTWGDRSDLQLAPWVYMCGYVYSYGC